ncbi:hypothetical protein [Treponema brennaborense]|uniref:Uncharacterized protein n=1 Tax=Treponema brennaborense (strain DSM 12168 / CIP 105900 / DD5/3) TaxID=906968 RepID=F4LM59_TREBD|nr:hypothetical protein [Treponema brennaborense]AEE16738.1 hypothetical protein Trebr_1311 [Treponema brennaborense DSM 12168]
MLQFYFLSVLLNMVTGLLLVFTADSTEQQDTPPLQDGTARTLTTFLDGKNFRLVLGVLTVLVGLMKLLSVVQNDVPVVGDLIPAAAGLLGGFCILLEYYMATATVEIVPAKFVETVFIKGRKFIGIFCIAAGLVHFIFPKVLFL